MKKKKNTTIPFGNSLGRLGRGGAQNCNSLNWKFKLNCEQNIINIMGMTLSILIGLITGRKSMWQIELDINSFGKLFVCATRRMRNKNDTH